MVVEGGDGQSCPILSGDGGSVVQFPAMGLAPSS